MSARLTRAERQLLRRAERAVDRMSPIEREIFLSIRVDELSYGEVATLHGISVTEVDRHFAAAHPRPAHARTPPQVVAVLAVRASFELAKCLSSLQGG
jgi:RNA polymerase sigma-70 factor (ECF subfamily)